VYELFEPEIFPLVKNEAAKLLMGSRREVVRIRVIFWIVLRLSNRLVIILAINGLILVFIKNLGKDTIFIDNYQIKTSFYLILRMIT
jgi:hypothetical protein